MTLLRRKPLICRLAGAVSIVIWAHPVLPAVAQTVPIDVEAVPNWEELFEGAAPGNNKHFCAIVLTEAGTLKASPDNLELTSRSFGGLPGRASVMATNSSYRLSLANPVSFTSAPSGAASGTDFSASYSGNGATEFSETPGGIDVRIKRGVSSIDVNLTASRTTPNPFPTGDYSAVATLRCE